MGGISLRNLRTFRKLCGEDTLENVVVVTTQWNRVPEKDRERMEKREAELMKAPDKFFEPLIAAGGQFRRYDNTEGSARSVVETLLNQIEMRNRKALEETTTGSEL